MISVRSILVIFKIHTSYIPVLYVKFQTPYPGKPFSLSSDDDMIDITHQGTVNEVHDHDEDLPPQSTSEYMCDYVNYIVQ